MDTMWICGAGFVLGKLTFMMEASTAWRAQLVKASSSEHEVSSLLSICLSGNSA